MRATDIIRNVLDLIDQLETTDQPELVVVDPVETETVTGLDQNRFQQIIDLLTSEYSQMYDNSPAEAVAGIESVTTNAGGGWNGPKNPADLRANSVSMFPNYQAKE